ncbi:MAG: alpha/beta fold hydrolase [Burkholderiales bacterium]
MANVPVILIHGFPLDKRMWADVSHSLRLKTYAFDLPGAGRSHRDESPDDHSIAAYARSMMGVFAWLSAKQAVFCGLSMGGYVVFEILRQFPDRVRAAILCNTKATPDTPEAKSARNALAARVQGEGTSALVDEMINRLVARVTRERRPEIVRAVTQVISQQNVPGMVGALRALRDRADSTPLLGQIRVPVLVIAGDDDQVTPAEGMREMARAIPDAEFVLIPEAGHLSPIEQPNAVSAAINDFLARL